MIGIGGMLNSERYIDDNREKTVHAACLAYIIILGIYYTYKQ